MRWPRGSRGEGPWSPSRRSPDLYGLINRFTAHPGRRDELARLMLAHEGPIPGCLSFVVAQDPADADALWITEVWESEAAWRASHDIPGIRESINLAIPLVAAWGEPVVTRPIGLVP